MKLNISKRGLYIILLFICLILAAVTSYLYITTKTSSLSTINYTVDKYSEVTSWCNTAPSDSKLQVGCKALLIRISNQTDGSTCFDVQVITNEKNLKNLTICEKGDTLNYSNSILGYKVLMPINISFTYNKKSSILKSYSFKNVSLSELDNSDIESIINTNIVTLVSLDPSNTTVKNSVDFCPSPSKLPDYITNDNKTKYTDFYNENLLNKIDYSNSYLYEWDDSVIHILFACDSAEIRGYNDVCNKTKVLGTSALPSTINHLGTVPQWGKTMDDTDKALLKQISLMYDSMYKNVGHTFANLGLMNTLTGMINSSTVSEDVFCGMYSLYNNLTKYNNSYTVDRDYIKDTVMTNISSVTSESCLKVDADLLDASGAYIKGSISNNSIFSSCDNLDTLLLNK